MCQSKWTDAIRRGGLSAVDEEDVDNKDWSSLLISNILEPAHLLGDSLTVHVADAKVWLTRDETVEVYESC